MNLSNNTVLITGGATGIGLALAEQFLNAGSKVIICARRKESLDEAKRKFPSLITDVCDVSERIQREELAKWVINNHPDVNVLINNAGIQRQNNFRTGANRDSFFEEVNTNLLAQIDFCSLFIPHLLSKHDAVIINIGSGLGFVPIARMPVYCATKAAIHSFTRSLRFQLKDTAIKVFEIIPPTVDTNLDHGTRPDSFRGMPLDEFISQVMPQLKNDTLEVAVGMTKPMVEGARAATEEAFARMNG